MCEYCGCRQIAPLAELMDAHLALLDDAGEIRRALSHQEPVRAAALLGQFAEALDRHVRREEDGVFRALRDLGEYGDEVGELEDEHRDLHARITGLDMSDPGAHDALGRLFADLTDHIDKEDLGIFPVSVVSLGSTGWDTVARVHDEQPSFLGERQA
jgi:hemerythrin-like domain-containing protein